MSAWVWLIAIIAFGIIEASTMTLISIWFLVGSIGGMIAALLGANTITQIMVFTLTSAFFLLITRPFVKRFLSTEKTKTNADRVIDEIAIVTEDIDNFNNSGQVKIMGQIWSARTVQDNMTFHVGEQVLVKRISGVKLIVDDVEK